MNFDKTIRVRYRHVGRLEPMPYEMETKEPTLMRRPMYILLAILCIYLAIGLVVATFVTWGLSNSTVIENRVVFFFKVWLGWPMVFFGKQ
jgi:hypothetical protein